MLLSEISNTRHRIKIIGKEYEMSIFSRIFELQFKPIDPTKYKQKLLKIFYGKCNMSAFHHTKVGLIINAQKNSCCALNHRKTLWTVLNYLRSQLLNNHKRSSQNKKNNVRIAQKSFFCICFILFTINKYINNTHYLTPLSILIAPNLQ